jgi:phage/plasmid-like protein (TIGR03299 family)
MSDYFESGFAVRQPSWHGKENLIDQWPDRWESSEDEDGTKHIGARELAGLDRWNPVIAKSYAFSGVAPDGSFVTEPVDGAVGEYQEVPEFRRIVKMPTYPGAIDDAGKTLGMPRDPNFTPITNGELGEILEAVGLAGQNIKWDTAGSAMEGRMVWALALLDEPIKLPGDSSLTLPYLAVTNRNDAQGGCALRATTVRVVCANTFAAAEAEGSRTGAVFTFSHSRNWKDRMEEARQAVTGARKEIAAYEELANDLLGITITERQRELFVMEFIPAPPEGLTSTRVQNNVERARKQLRDLLNGPTTQEIQHTAFGLVQAAGEYLDHVRYAQSWETKLNRTLLRPEPLKAKARTLALAVAES